MLFNTPEYFFFFIVVLISYFSSPEKYKNIILLAASYFFYFYLKWEFGFLLLATTIVNYICGSKIGSLIEVSKPLAKKWLIFSIVFSLGVLAYFKYTGFFVNSTIELLNLFGANVSPMILKIMLPIGISFYTFQAMTYTIDVYRKKQTVERNFINFALFVSFFPTVLSGPIERSTNMLKQFAAKRNFSYENLLAGAKLIIWGLFKKMVIADRLASYVDWAYGSSGTQSGSTLLLASVFYTFQIYCDFSGYANIAIGSARMMGFSLMQNFNLPYFSDSIKNFWKRWHISLTSWFTEYVYFPLGGNRVTKSRWIFNIATIFLLSGLWHGAAWSFIAWGALHALYYLAEHYTNNGLKRIGWHDALSSNAFVKFFRILLCFFLVNLAWIPFRVTDFSQALYIVRKIFTDCSGIPSFGSSSAVMLSTILLLFFFIFVEVLQYKGYASHYFSESKIPAVMRVFFYALLVIFIALFGVTSSQFVYFQF
jgi:D-alanyl-lipoteichoic acid acyltransferase DltB (MBOAT superfamily)